MNNNRIAIIKIDIELEKIQRRITYANTPYHYVDMTLEFLEEYKEEYDEKEQLKLKNIEISKTNLDYVNKGLIYEIEMDKASDDTNFIIFAKKYEVKYVPYYKDNFLINNKDTLKILNHPDKWIDNENEDNKVTLLDNENNTMFLRGFSNSDNFVNDLSKKLGGELYYDIYDVDGFLSILTNDNDFDFYFDLGDISNSFIPKNLNPYGILITHYDRDHYNILLNYNFNASNYILPYGGSFLYNGRQLYPADEIRLISRFSNRAHLLIKGQSHQLGRRNQLVQLIMNNILTLYFPSRPSPNNRNIESINVNLNNIVFYPGDSMFYMYRSYINSIPNLVAAHHGGDTGIINLNYSGISDVIINTCTLNYGSAVYNNNLLLYGANGRTVHVINNFTGLRANRIIILYEPTIK